MPAGHDWRWRRLRAWPAGVLVASGSNEFNTDKKAPPDPDYRPRKLPRRSTDLVRGLGIPLVWLCVGRCDGFCQAERPRQKSAALMTCMSNMNERCRDLKLAATVCFAVQHVTTTSTGSQQAQRVHHTLSLIHFISTPSIAPFWRTPPFVRGHIDSSKKLRAMSQASHRRRRFQVFSVGTIVADVTGKNVHPVKEATVLGAVVLRGYGAFISR